MINMVTKSGTNAYHGGAYDYGNNEGLSAHAPYTGLRPKVRQTDYGDYARRSAVDSESLQRQEQDVLLLQL